MHDLPQPEFLVRYRSHLEQLQGLVRAAAPDFVVAIARKGPRLAELCDRAGLPLFPSRTSVVSHKALPFMTADYSKGKRVLVFDDSVIWGSTMRDVLNHPSLSGAEVLPIALAASRARDREKVPNLGYVIDLHPDDVMSFSVELVRSFGSLAKPYNTDHPILQITGPATVELSLDYVAERAREELGSKVFRLTDPTANPKSCTSNIVLDEPRINGWDSQASSRLMHVSKVRIFKDPAAQTLRIEPILLFKASKEELQYQGFPVANAKRFSDLYEELRRIVTRNVSSESGRVKALFALRMFLQELPYGILAAKWLADAFGLDIGQQPLLSPYDTELAFGKDVGRHILEVAASGAAATNKVQSVIQFDPVPLAHDPNGGCSTETVKYAREVVAGVAEDMAGADLADSVAAIVSSLVKLDDNTRQPGLHIENRLDFGFSLPEIRWMLEELFHRGHVQPFQLSAVMDHLIDNGVVVPLVRLGESGVLERVFRFGEARHALFLLRYAVRQCCGELADWLRRLTGANTIPATLTDKALVLIARVGELTGAITSQRFAVKIAFNKYGADLQVSDVLSEGRLLKWALANGILEGAKNGLHVNERFDERFAPSATPLDRLQRVLITSVTQWFADAVTETDDSIESVCNRIVADHLQ